MVINYIYNHEDRFGEYPKFTLFPGPGTLTSTVNRLGRNPSLGQIVRVRQGLKAQARLLIDHLYRRMCLGDPGTGFDNSHYSVFDQSPKSPTVKRNLPTAERSAAILTLRIYKRSHRTAAGA